jgi:GntR family transcriptional regulator
MNTKPAPVTPDAGVPLHRQLFLVLRDEIARGAIDAGDPLPTEQALCEQFGVSRITVRRALADLADQGYVERRHGVGSFARRPAAPVSRTASGSYMDELRQTEFETAAEVLELDLRPTPRSVSEKVELSDESLHITRVRRERRTAEPLMVTEAWLPAGLAASITGAKLRRAPLYRLLSDAGITIDRMQHEISAEIAGPRYAQLLDTAIGSALLRVDRIAFVDDVAHHMLSIRLSPGRSRIIVNQSAERLDDGEGFAIAHDVGRP